MTPDDLENLLITIDLRTLGELASDVVKAWCKYKQVELPTMHDDQGKVTKDGETIALSAWDSITRMYDRGKFADSVMKDLELL